MTVDQKQLVKELREIRETAWNLRNANSWYNYNKFMYEWVRNNKPELMAEAGVAGGATSYCILKAMEKNGEGRLYSFDPGHEHVGDESNIGLENADYKDHEPGALIPDDLKDRWNFYKMKFVEGEDVIREVVENEKKFDAFFHDSDHSDENINAEFEMMKNYVKEDGYFMIHDPPTDKVWNEFELVEAGRQQTDTLEKGVDKDELEDAARKWALKVFKRA